MDYTGKSAGGRRTEERDSHRRREQEKRRKLILLGALALSWILLAVCLVNLLKMQARLKEPDEAPSYGDAASMEAGGAVKTDDPGGKPEGSLPDGTDEDVPYPDRCGLDRVAKPEKRTRRQVLARLRELGEDSPLIADILQEASGYPEELMEALANNPEMADFVSRWDGIKESGAGGLTDAEKKQEFPLFLQWDPRWGYVGYGDGSCIGLAGCGPACLSMALYYLTGDEGITPDKVGAYSMENGFYVPGAGTAWALFETMPADYGIQVKQPGASESGMKQILDDGGVIILSMAPGYFTAGGHFIVVYGYDEEGFFVNDPNCVARSRRKWSYSEIGTQIKNMWSLSGGPFGDPPVEYYG